MARGRRTPTAIKKLQGTDQPCRLIDNEMGKYFDCIEIIKTKGYTCVSDKGAEYQRPEVGIANMALKNAMSIADKFGFNPASRTKISVPKKDTGDAFDKLG